MVKRLLHGFCSFVLFIACIVGLLGCATSAEQSSSQKPVERTANNDGPRESGQTEAPASEPQVVDPGSFAKQDSRSKTEAAAVKNIVSLASWNMHDFFDAIDDPNSDEVLAPREYAIKLEELKAGLDVIDADIVAVQEVEKLQNLQMLASRAGYPYVCLVEGNDTMRGIDVGLMSRIPIKNYVSHAQDVCVDPDNEHAKPTRFSRDCLEVHLDHPSSLVVLVNHFKSQARTDKAAGDSKRAAQANRAREIAASLAQHPVALVGDLNADPDHMSMRPLANCEFLHDVLSVLPTTQRVTYKSRKYRSSLDYIFVNDKLQPCVVADSAQIVMGSAIKKASDHRAIRVQLDLTKVGPEHD